MRTSSGAVRRQDIQGLRAVGALLVATFHIWFGKVSGGVDVFFVVSGYLMIGSLARQADRSGAIDLWEFAAGLARRLLPASYAVLAAVALTAPLWMPQTRWELFLREVVASAAYLENWLLAALKVDYLDRDQAASPLQHFWAMGVQLQAMAFFGLALALAVRIDKRLVRPVVAAVCILSFGLALWHTASDQPFAYFNTFARLWEFALGGLVALYGLRVKAPEGVAAAAGWLGLAAIISCGFVLPVASSFPGWAALWPTAGACLVLLFGADRSSWSVGRLLGSRLFTWLGDRSYALYLWHWPLLVLYLTLDYRLKAGLPGGVAVLGASVLLAYLTTRFEDRFRRKKGATWPTLFAGVGAALAFAVAALPVYVYLKWAIPQHRLDPPRPQTHPGAAQFALRPSTERLYPGPLWVRHDLPDMYDDGCHQSMRGTKVLSCTYGEPTAKRTLALVGGSHSAQWLPALQELIGGTDWKVVTYTKSACLFSADMPPGSCAEWNAAVMKELLRTRPDAVMTLATTGPVAGGADETPPGFVAQWRVLGQAGVKVVAIRDTPRMMFLVPECVDLLGEEAPECSRPRRQMLAEVNPALAVRTPNVQVVDMTRYFCDHATCPPVAGNLLIYRDNHHISTAYARSLAPMLRQEIAATVAFDRQLASSR